MKEPRGDRPLSLLDFGWLIGAIAESSFFVKVFSSRGDPGLLGEDQRLLHELTHALRPDHTGPRCTMYSGRVSSRQAGELGHPDLARTAVWLF